MSRNLYTFRPWRFIYTAGLTVLAWAWFGWWAVALMALIQVDILQLRPEPLDRLGRGADGADSG
jgi:hypothetical protein